MIQTLLVINNINIFCDINKNNNIIEQREYLSSRYNKKEIEMETETNSTVYIEYEVPTLPTFPKFFTDYRYYGIEGTPHYRLQQECWTDEIGCRRLNDDYVVALGSYYSTNIGDRFEVTFDNGNIITVVMGDGKHDSDCDERNMFTPYLSYDNEKCGNLLEFIVDKNVLNSAVYDYGSLDCVEVLNGNVIKMVYIGRYEHIDFDTYY